MGDSNSTNNQTTDIVTRLQKLLVSHEKLLASHGVLLDSQEALLSGYQALYSALRAIIEANDKKNFLSDNLKNDIHQALDTSGKSLTDYLENIQKAKES